VAHDVAHKNTGLASSRSSPLMQSRNLFSFPSSKVKRSDSPYASVIKGGGMIGPPTAMELIRTENNTATAGKPGCCDDVAFGNGPLPREGKCTCLLSLVHSVQIANIATETPQKQSRIAIFHVKRIRSQKRSKLTRSFLTSHITGEPDCKF